MTLFVKYEFTAKHFFVMLALTSCFHVKFNASSTHSSNVLLKS